jgi:hypothetical protein
MGTLSGVFPCDLGWANSLSEEVRGMARAQAFDRVLRMSLGRPVLEPNESMSNSKTPGANAIMSEAIKVASQREHRIRLTEYSLASRRDEMRQELGDDSDATLVRPQVSESIYLALSPNSSIH